MNCVFCNHNKTAITNTKNSEQVIKRFRKCLKCNRIFKTEEFVHMDKYEFEKYRNNIYSNHYHPQVRERE